MFYQNPRQTGAANPRVEFSRREHIAYRLFRRSGKFNPLHFGGKLFQEYLVVQQVHAEIDAEVNFRLLLFLPFLVFAVSSFHYP